MKSNCLCLSVSQKNQKKLELLEEVSDLLGRSKADTFFYALDYYIKNTTGNSNEYSIR
jgi:hypothetical protein